MTTHLTEGPICPLPITDRDTIILGHGSGGKLTHDLIRNIFHQHFSNIFLDQNDDGARLPTEFLSGTPVVSIDGHVVKPIFFPGGDIGRLAICGTVNDVAMMGAMPLYLTASFILEEGLVIEDLERVVISMEKAAREAGILIVAGDTKVVEKGKADQVYISTSGFGVIPPSRGLISGSNAQPGDKVLLSGSLGDHGIAVLSARNELSFKTDILSDVSPLNGLIEKMLCAAPNTHVLRDPTRGGLATTLIEIAKQSHVSILINEDDVPVKPAVKAACEMLGFDPLYLANEGKFIAIIPENEADQALSILKDHPYGKDASIIGSVENSDPESVILLTPYGSSRLLTMLAGELLPRIC
jgi:hydrogenase expression/formation protein HypE